METKICKDCGRELPIKMFKKTRYGDRVSVCTECATKKMRENKEKKRIEEAIKVREQARIDAEVKTTLSSFTPRQLMEELARRGYKGELTFVQKIDITNF
jgi:ribosome-binding protein aMBF1 (putative translation factor)